jgi:hypothetical protein
MRQFWLGLLTGACLAGIGIAGADTGLTRFSHGNDLLDRLRDRDNSINYQMGLSYVAGGIDMMLSHQYFHPELTLAKGICLPTGVTLLQLVDIVRLRLEEYPENRHLPSAVMVSGAIRGAFPCR